MWQKTQHRCKLHQSFRNERGCSFDNAVLTALMSSSNKALPQHSKSQQRDKRNSNLQIELFFSRNCPCRVSCTDKSTVALFPLVLSVLVLLVPPTLPCSQHGASGTSPLLEERHNWNNRSHNTFPKPLNNSCHNLSLKPAHFYRPC